MSRTRTYVLLIALLLRSAVAQQSNPFTVEEWDVVAGTTFAITWEPTTEGTVSISLVFDGDGTGNEYSELAADIPNSGSFDWAVPDDNNSMSSCYIQLRPDSNRLVTNSAIFSISDAESEDPIPPPSTSSEPPISTTEPPTLSRTPTTNSRPVTTDSLTSATPPPSTSALSAPSSDTTAGSAIPPASSSPSSTGLSAGAAAGVGVGATLGALILLGIAGFFWWRQRKGSPKSESSVPARAGFFGWRKRKGDSEPEMGASGGALGIGESESKKRAAELEGTGKMPVELQGTPRAELEC